MSVTRLASKEGSGREGVAKQRTRPVTDKELVHNLHEDMKRLTESVESLNETIKPMAEHMPTLVEIAVAWKAGKNGFSTAGRITRVIGAFLKWTGGVAVSVASIYLLLHGKLSDLVGGHQP